MDWRLDSPVEGAIQTADVGGVQIQCPAQQEKGPRPKKYHRGREQTRKWPHLIKDPARGIWAFLALHLFSPSLHSSYQLDFNRTNRHCLIKAAAANMTLTLILIMIWVFFSSLSHQKFDCKIKPSCQDVWYFAFLQLMLLLSSLRLILFIVKVVEGLWAKQHPEGGDGEIL